MGAAAAAPASAASFRYGVIAKQAALILLDSIPALGLFAPNPRACEGRAEPAPSVSSATHIQVVSRATRDQADPLAPAGRRLAAVATSKQ